MKSERINLLSVLDHFDIQGRGLVVAPDFSVPSGKWQSREEEVLVITPEGKQFKAKATFQLSHFNIRDPKVPIDKRWRVTMIFPGLHAPDVPIGSEVWISNILHSSLIKNETLINRVQPTSLRSVADARRSP